MAPASNFTTAAIQGCPSQGCPKARASKLGFAAPMRPAASQLKQWPHYLRLQHATTALSSPRPHRGSHRSSCPAPPHAASSSSGPSSRPLARTKETIEKEDYSTFVRFLHLASPYVVGHRGRIFVIVIPGAVVQQKDRLVPFLEDILLLHGLGVQLVIVAGAKEVIDEALRRENLEPRWEGAYRVTDGETMRVAVEAAGSISTEIAAQLSRAPSIPMMRRHARGEGTNWNFAPAVQVVSGNYVTAKRRGIVNGVDFGYMGQVRFVQRDSLRRQLDSGNIVVLTNVGVSTSGELLNCNSYDVATHAAVELAADKLLVLTGEDVRELALPHYLPLVDAQSLIYRHMCAPGDDACVVASLNSMGQQRKQQQQPQEGIGTGNGSSSSAAGSKGGAGVLSSPLSNGGPSPASSNGVEMLLDLDTWRQSGAPQAVVSAVVACRAGVKRAHLIDMDEDGALLLEMYTRDGITGVCMIAADLYEGIRGAHGGDVPGVTRLLSLLAEGGDDIPYAPEEAADHLERITVVEREGRVLACAAWEDLGVAPDGLYTAELAAFIVDPAFRRQGLGDSLLDYVEQALRRRGYRRVVLVADQGSYEWFQQRAFENEGPALASSLIPESRASQVDPVAKLLVKSILELDAALDAPAGKRIGF